ncbi:MAG TPA: ribosome maturation factor RimP [Acidimicrobiales bacterium]
MGVVERVSALATPLLADLGLEIYDIEHGGGTLRITVDRVGGVDLEAIAVATRVISRELDHTDPIPGRYTLEVTSPGLERTLRTPAHFRKAVGTTVSVRTHPHVEGSRRAHGVLQAADDDGITVLDTEVPGERRLRYDDIERARTVFEWGPTPKRAPAKGSSSARPKGAQKHEEAKA